jgi:putative SOS response-associated peptidase YedK
MTLPIWNTANIAHFQNGGCGAVLSASLKKRLCLIPVDGFYEWRKVVGGKIPYSIGMKNDSPFVFAGLWKGWKDRGTEE